MILPATSVQVSKEVIYNPSRNKHNAFPPKVLADVLLRQSKTPKKTPYSDLDSTQIMIISSLRSIFSSAGG